MIILKNNIAEAYTELLASPKTQHAAQNSLLWLWGENPRNLDFRPDYFTLSSIGRTRAEAFLNRNLARCSPYLWQKTLWFSIYQQIYSRMQSRFLKQLEKTPGVTKELPKAAKRYLKLINTTMSAGHPNLRHVTFTDLFLFLRNSLTGFFEHLGLDYDIYRLDKELHNEQCLKIYREIKNELWDKPQKLELALYLSLRANWLDCVEDNVADFMPVFLEEINQLLDDGEDLENHKRNNPYFQLSNLIKRLNVRPQTILFELDNSGEVILDLLLIELLLLQGHKIIIAAKATPIINDITLADLNLLLQRPEFIFLQAKLAAGQLRTISTGSTVAGKYLFSITKEYQQAYLQADLIMLKGQGNFQTMPLGQRKKGQFVLYPYQKPVVYMMGVKANLVHLNLQYIFGEKEAPKKQTPFLYIHAFTETNQ